MKTAVILCAGAGQRFWPYNEVRNKTAIPVMNRPNVCWLAENLVACGVERLIVVVGAFEASVRAALQGVSVPIAFIRQNPPSGTAYAVMSALPLIGEEPFLVAYGDICTPPETLRRLIETHRASGALATAVFQPFLPQHDPRDWIGAYVRDGKLLRMEAHSADTSHRLGGLYAFEPAIRDALNAHPGLMTSVPVGGMPPMEAELAQTLQTVLEMGYDVPAVEPVGFLVDIDKPWHVWEANARWLDWQAARLERDQIGKEVRIDDSAEIEGRLVVEEGAEIGKRVVIRGNAFIGRQSRILNGAILQGHVAIGARSHIKDYCLVTGTTVIGNGCIVGHDAEMDGVMLDGSFLFHYCEIMGVVGQKVDIGAATVCGTLRFDDGDTVHTVRGRRERPEFGANGTYFGDFSRTGVNVITMPGVKIGAYSCVGAGIVVYEDIPSRKLVLLKQELVFKDWGPERYGW
ncbi:MAG: NTP transferase domain-containing protein [Armatimonadetes bacterium]|nr:NTP transferase domain-containing protein [Armatimonadota bacterium]